MRIILLFFILTSVVYAQDNKRKQAYQFFQKGEYDTAKTQCFNFISNEASEEYWRVKSFILLADLFVGVYTL